MTSIDPPVIQRCIAGDKAAFREIVIAYQRLLFGVAFKMLCDEDEAKDILQESFIHIWQHLEDYDQQRNFGSWVYGITVHLCLDRLRQKDRWGEMPEDEELLAQFADDPEPDRQLENSELAGVIRGLVSRLSDQQRIAFTLVHLENLTVAEASTVSGIPADKLKSNLYVARQNIRKQLIQSGYE